MEVLNAAPAVVETPAPSAAPNATTQGKGTEIKGEPEKGSPKQSETFELTVNGKPRKYTLEELKMKASLGEAANERFQKASEIEKRFESTKAELKKDFMKVLLAEDTGLTKEQVRERFEHWYKENFIDPETMDPRDVKLREYERREKEREAQEQAEKERIANEAKAQETSKIVESMQKDIIAVVEESGLPKTRFTAARVAYWMRQNLKNGYDAPKEVIVQQVREERDSLVSSMVREASGEQLVEMLGEDLVKKIRDYDIALLKKKLNVNEPKPMQRPGERKERPTSKDVERYFNELRRLPVPSRR